MNTLIEMMGKRFGKLEVVGRAPPHPTITAARWICRCDCGGEITVVGKSLRVGATTSCGCKSQDQQKGHTQRL